MADITNEFSSQQKFHLPGFRFHPTEEELVDFYLKNMVFGKKLSLDVISYTNIYLYDPNELPRMAKIDGEREWYFFVQRERKNGSRPNRITEKGYWKATGSDRKIWRMSELDLKRQHIGVRKTLVFYKGRAPRGSKTDWIMNEYRLPYSSSIHKVKFRPFRVDIVLCKIYRKATSMRVLEQRALMEEHQQTLIMNNNTASCSSFDTNMSMSSSFSYPHQQEEDPLHQTFEPITDQQVETFMKREADDPFNDDGGHKTVPSCSLQHQFPEEGKLQPLKLAELQVPKFSMDWSQLDAFWLTSPWLNQNLTLLANLLNL
ncbi:NAC domain-containing protein 6 [Linum perenne]